ncbi:alpha- and gamma-adaptin-binding protein p34 [Pseudopipra pipra]
MAAPPHPATGRAARAAPSAPPPRGGERTEQGPNPLSARLLPVPPPPRAGGSGGRGGRGAGAMAAEAAAGPLALVTSCAAGFAPEELVKRITGKDDLTVGAITSGRVTFYPWTIDNKYYSADIHLCVVPNTFHVTGEIAESVQAFVVYFDSTTKTGLESVSEWLPLTEEWLPEVLILVCDRVSENGVNRQKAQEWCIKHGFELVELNPEELPDEDDDFPESTGVKRIVQALNANVWSNVVMKSDRTQGFGLLSTLAGANRSVGSEETQETESNPSPADREDSQADSREDGAGTNNLQLDNAAGEILLCLEQTHLAGMVPQSHWEK